MTIEVESVHGQICRLAESHARGDVSEKMFQRENEKLTLALCRLLVRERFENDEAILAEHHVVRAHTKLVGSVLRESEQETIALLATDRRVFRLRCFHAPGGALTVNAGGRDLVEELPYAQIRQIVVRRELRVGQLVAGMAILAMALFFRSWLQVTGIALMLVGAAGALHSLLVPTRWAEIVADRVERTGPLEVYALRKRSARKLLKLVSDRTNTA